MAWSNVAADQMVSFTDAQTGGFTLNSGQSSVTSNQCMTKSDAFTKYSLTATASTNALASNQLMRKDYWVSGAVCYVLADIGRDPDSSYIACENANFGSYILVSANAPSLLGATLLYNRCPPSAAATAGWYSDGARARQWNGSAFVGSPVQCII